ncbi:MAG: MerR family transcriptional regulator, heat shock protein HspR [Verrucomicrobiota bacterium]|jgi:DNA-binding transcriptional MerR regulator
MPALRLASKRNEIEFKELMARSTSTSEVVTGLSRAIQIFEPPADAVFTIEGTAHLANVPRRTILIYCKHRLVSPIFDRDGGYYFDRNSIRALRRIEELRPICGDDLAGIKIILDLTDKLERLHSEVRSLSQQFSSRKSKSK